MTAKDDEQYMRLALLEAAKAEKAGDVPVGAVLLSEAGDILAKAYNRRERDGDAIAHAEILAIRTACKRLHRWNLSGCTLYVTLEPCVMCAGAIIHSRIRRVVFGAFDQRFGCCGSLHNLVEAGNFNHKAVVTGGILEPECKAKLQNFFNVLRSRKHSPDDH